MPEIYFTISNSIPPSNVRNERGNLVIDPADAQGLVADYEELHVDVLSSLSERQL